MSQTNQPPRVSRGWQRVAVVSGTCAALGVMMFIFTGDLPGLGFLETKSPLAPPPDVRANTTIRKVDRLQTTPAAYQQPKPQAQPTTQPAQQQPAEDWSKAQLAALNAKPAILESTPVSHPAPTQVAAKQNLRGSLTGEADGAGDAFTNSLKPSTLDGAHVVELGSPRWMIQQGRLIQCQQITRMSSKIPGMVTATVSESNGGVTSDTGDVILLPNGSRAVGVMRSVVMHGIDRIAVMWMQITTPVLYDRANMPHHYRIGVESPFSDPMGETGADGDVNHHWLPKIGAILGASLLHVGGQVAVAAAQPNNSANTSINLGGLSSGVDAATGEFLHQILSMPDVLTRNEGRECAIFVARDLLMDGPYRLYLLNKFGG